MWFWIKIESFYSRIIVPSREKASVWSNALITARWYGIVIAVLCYMDETISVTGVNFFKLRID